MVHTSNLFSYSTLLLVFVILYIFVWVYYKHSGIFYYGLGVGSGLVWVIRKFLSFLHSLAPLYYNSFFRFFCLYFYWFGIIYFKFFNVSSMEKEEYRCRRLLVISLDIYIFILKLELRFLTFLSGFGLFYYILYIPCHQLNSLVNILIKVRNYFNGPRFSTKV